MKSINKEMGERIFIARSMKGYTREFLVERAGISAKFLYEIETGRKGFSSSVLSSLCSALGLSADYVLFGREDMTCNKQLVGTLELFGQQQAEVLVTILNEIYRLSTIK